MQVDYQSVGSGSGVKSFIDGTVDFAASDSAMKPDDLAKVDRGVLLLPMTAGSIVLAYNLEGISKLKLSQRVNNCKGNKKDKVEQALKRAAL